MAVKIRIIVLSAIVITILALVFRTCSSPPHQGEKLYSELCANCHMESGKGLGKAIPPLANSDYLVQNRDAFACMLRNGLHDTIKVNGVSYDTPMEGNPTLTEVQIVNIANYVYQSWGNQAEEFTLGEVQKQLENCE